MGDNQQSPSPLPTTLPETLPNNNEETEAAPVQVLVFLHKGIKSELELLKTTLATRAVEERGLELSVEEIKRRLEFVRSVYSYHSAAEDQIIFLALDVRVENVVGTYSLEHQSIDRSFDFVFSLLNGLLEDQGNGSKDSQELVFRISALTESICQHMVKEEEQVFPLLLKHFSHEEQASLVWQYMCSVPVMLMEKLFPWLGCLLSQDEQLNMKHCILKVVPQDKQFQEVVITWLEKSYNHLVRDHAEVATSVESRKELCDVKEALNSHLPQCSSGKGGFKHDSHILVRDGPFDGILLWHSAIKSDLKDILDRLRRLRFTEHSNLTGVFVRVNFLIDVLLFYSKALEEFFYPILDRISAPKLSPLHQLFPYKIEVEGLYQILYDAHPTKLETLCIKVEALALATTKHFSFLETEVFPIISKNCNHEAQREILFSSICILPLGLLKCVATWFSPHLPKDKLRSILQGIKQSDCLDESFASLLHEWVRIGYSGKTTVEDLLEIFNSPVSYVSEQIQADEYPCKTYQRVNFRCWFMDRTSISDSLSRSFCLTKKHGTLYSSGTNLLVFSSQSSNGVYTNSGLPCEATSNYPEAMPIDHIYYFHKALKKDLESLVIDTTKLTENMGLLMDFIQRFHLVQSLYELHSETEDEIAFPALEAKQVARNITQAYNIDHKLEAECFNRVLGILNEMLECYNSVSDTVINPEGPVSVMYNQLCLKLRNSCRTLKKVLSDHIDREEMELWPLFREHFSVEEQEKIIGYMLGRTKAETLQEMIVWLMASLTPEERRAMITFWRKAAKYTKFDEWLGEWWDGVISYGFAEADESNISSSQATEPSKVVSKYSQRMAVGCDLREKKNDENVRVDDTNIKTTRMVKEMEGLDVASQTHKESLEFTTLLSEKKEKHRREPEPNDVINESSQLPQAALEVQHQNRPSSMSQVEMEGAIRKISQNSSLDMREKTLLIQNLMTSHWIAAQPVPELDDVVRSEPGKLPGQFPSYRGSAGSVFGCKHYKQNCKLVAACCNQLFTCRRCHDEVADHLMDRKSTTQMMCMKCLEIQQIGSTCMTPSCNSFPMAKYFCRICRLFDDSREIYHCPYCNLCRVGKGLGIDYFHCMKCNACMSRSLSDHTCREKCFEDKCPICHEDIFTSSSPIKALSCGHLMHSTCFQEYTRMHYTCPVCSKSLGNMQVYFEMLDALLAEEKMPDEFLGQTQAILCNDCEKKGTAPFHWLYHKCPICGSFNTRLL